MTSPNHNQTRYSFHAKIYPLKTDIDPWHTTNDQLVAAFPSPSIIASLELSGGNIPDEYQVVTVKYTFMEVPRNGKPSCFRKKAGRIHF